MEPSAIIKKIFAEVSEAIASFSEEDFRKLSGEDYSISLRIQRTRSKIAGGAELSIEEKQALIVDLENADTREDGLQVLEDSLSTKKVTEEFARFLDISVLKQDKLVNIREKIVEATIGARLRSQAIQGKKT